MNVKQYIEDCLVRVKALHQMQKQYLDQANWHRNEMIKSFDMAKRVGEQGNHILEDLRDVSERSKTKQKGYSFTPNELSEADVNKIVGEEKK